MSANMAIFSADHRPQICSPLFYKPSQVGIWCHRNIMNLGHYLGHTNFGDLLAPGRVALQGYFRDRHRALRARPLKGSGRPQVSPAPQALGAEGNAAQMLQHPIAECKNMIKLL
jgi:hypothetical protein